MGRSPRAPALLLFAMVIASAPPGCAESERASESRSLMAVRGECYVVADGTDQLFVVDTTNLDPATNATLVGSLGAADVEAIALDPIDGTLYAANAGQLGTIDVNTGVFSARAQPVGTGRGALGNVLIDDIDGLAFDPCSGILFGSHRGVFSVDLLVQIDRTTGALLPDAFAAGVDYVSIAPVAGQNDIDDIAIDPVSCQMFAVANGSAADRLVRIDERTGATSGVGVMGVADVEGLAFDASGQLWGSTGLFAATTGVYLVDTSTGVASMVRGLTASSDYEALACLSDGDRDGDGIPDIGEATLGTDPDDADSDDDGIEDGVEARERDDIDGDGLTPALDPDSDDDGLADGTEAGVTAPGVDTDVGRGNFVADADPSTTTNPFDRDSDGGGVADGSEDTDHDGALDTLSETDPNNGADDVALPDSDGDGLGDAEEETIGSDPDDADSDDDGVVDGLESNAGFDTDGDGLTNVLDPDSDDDLLPDGTESGVATPDADTDVSTGNFVADSDPSSTTFALLGDSDRGGVRDGSEDTDKDGAFDVAELDPNNRRDDASAAADNDGDGLLDGEEIRLGSDPADADTDDDGVLDGGESNGSLDTDGDGILNILDPDSDGDGLTDGTEVGITVADADTDVSAGSFTADADPGTTTSMVDADSDDGGVSDGDEDASRDGRVDAGERDPNDPADDRPGGGADSDGDGVLDEDDNCPDVVNPAQTDLDRNGVGDDCEVILGGGGCSSGGSRGGLLLILLLVIGCSSRGWRSLSFDR